MKDKLKAQKISFIIAINVLLMAILLRLIGFFRGTSFFLDELNVARNIAEKSYFELFFPLEYDQFLPPFFAQLLKGNAAFWGYSEYGLRLLPCLAGVWSLVLFYILLRRFFNSWVLIYPLILFIFNFYLYQQGLSLKQYSMDVLLAILWWYIAIIRPNPKGKTVFYLGIFGAISVWLSMPIVFILSGVGLYFLWKRWQEKERDFRQLLPLFLMIGAWLISFGGLFWINLQYGVSDDYQQQYHHQYFMQFPTSFAHIEQTWKLFVSIFRAIVGRTGLAIGWAMLCFSLGIFHVFKKEKSLLILLLTPLLTCFFASMLQYYSLIIRLTLFLFPSILILMGFGVVFIIEKIDFANKKRRWIALPILLFLMIFSAIHRNALPYFLKENIRGNGRLVLEKIAETKEASLPLYATNFGVPAYDFYTKYYKTPLAIDSKTTFYGDWNDNLTVLAKKWKGQGMERIWIFDTHTFGKDKAKLEEDIFKIGVVEMHFKEIYADAYLVKLK